MFRRFKLAALLVACLSAPAAADSFNFAVQPIQSAAKTQAAFQPLADYLSKATGHQIKLLTSPNFLAYWQSMKRGDYDILLDGAHLTDYRTQKMGWTAIAKQLDKVSISLATGEGVFLFDPLELAGKKVAVQPAPSAPALVLNRFFTNPLRKPVLVEVSSTEEAAEKTLKGETVAAVIPSPLLQAYPKLNLMTSTEQWPQPGFSTSPKVSAEARKALSEALINASKTPDGQKMLQAINLPGFEPATNDTYKGFESWLKGVHGY
jgi:phosphonate transport system substrate-binding protein